MRAGTRAATLGAAPTTLTGEGSKMTADTRIRPRTRMLVGICVGNFLEFYNFGVYAFFAPMLAAAYFPKGDHLVALTLALLTFAIGFLARPLGAAVVAAYSKRRGRPAALMLTFSLMGLGSALIALTPGYARIGLAAPVVVLIGRLIQGFSDGGEVGPATTLLFDLEPEAGRSGIISLQIITQLFALLAAVIVGALLSTLLSHDALYGWGWRVPFLLGLLIVPVGVAIRNTETMEHPPGAIARRDAARQDGRQAVLPAIALVLLTITCGTIATYIRSFGVSYAIAVLHLPPATAMLGMCAGLAAGIVGGVLGVTLAVRLGVTRLVISCLIGTMLLTWPLYRYAIAQPGLASQVLLNVVLFLLMMLPAATMWRLMLAVLPEENRSFAFGLLYAVAVSIFGGFTQPVLTWLIGHTGSAMVPAWVSIALAPVGSAAMLTLERRVARARRAAPAFA